MFSVILLTFFFIHSCQFANGEEIDKLMIFPIEQTSYIVYLDQKLRSSISASINGESISITGTEFWTTKTGSDFTRDITNEISINKKSASVKTKVGPVLPLHAGFCTRKTDENEKIRIEFNWQKEYLSADNKQRGYSFEYEIKLFNYKGDHLGDFTIEKPNDLKKPYIHTTKITPTTPAQKYSEGKPSDAADVLNIVIRVKSGDESSPWTHHGVHPEDKYTQEIASQQDWTLQETVKQHSAFMMLSESQNKNDNDDLFGQISWLTLFSQAAALSEETFSENRYLAVISIPNDANNLNYNLRDIGQRSGSGFGLLRWSTNGHNFTEKFTQHFMSNELINTNLLESLLKTCFAYGNILNADAGKKSQSEAAPMWRNANKNDEWRYEFDSLTLTATRKMSSYDDPTRKVVGKVDKITWIFNSDSWITTPEGTLKQK